jgi:hypothetical protein
MFAAGSFSGTTGIYSAGTPRPVAVLEGHTGGVTQVGGPVPPGTTRWQAEATQATQATPHSPP